MPDPMRELRAGPLTAWLDGTELRYLCLGGTEIVRRVYVAVRDPLWGTVPGLVHDLVVDASEVRFEVHFDVNHDVGALAFNWHGSIIGDELGHVQISMSGEAKRELVYNRIGICLLLPPGLAGHSVRGHGPEGAWQGEFPREIGPQRNNNGVLLALHPPSERIEMDLTGGATFVLDFKGDLFEMEDQRNWTDASFKVYSTPLALGLPHRCPAGNRLEQQVTLSVEGAGGAPIDIRPSQLYVGEPTGTLVPRIGIGFSSPPASHSAEQLDLLAMMGLAHLRLDCHLGSPGWEEGLHEAVRVCEALGAELELALFLHRGSSNLRGLADALCGAPVTRLLAFAEGAVTNGPDETSPAWVIALLRGHLGARYPILGGTDLNFCELNRTRPDIAAVDGIVWPMTPQVHAFDDLSIIETPEAQAAQVATAHRFAPGRPLFVSPITLLPRYNPNVAGERGPSPWDGRQATLLGAAFTLSSAKQLSEAGVDAVTYYETVGLRGVLTGATSSPTPERHNQIRAYPLFHILADVAAMAGREVLMVKSSRPLTVTGLAAQGPNGTTLLIANTTPTCLAVGLKGVQRRGVIRRLRATTAECAAVEPESFRNHVEAFEAGVVDLDPYETVRIDFAN